MENDYLVWFFDEVTMMYREITYFHQLTAMSARIYWGSFCIYTDFIIVCND